jgi:hypothetical protein
MGFQCIDCVPYVSTCETLQWCQTYTYWRLCWFISFSPVIRELAFRVYLNMWEMEWVRPVGKHLQTHFLLSVFCVCGKTNNADGKINIFFPHYSYAEVCTTCSLSECHTHIQDTSCGCSVAYISYLWWLAWQLTWDKPWPVKMLVFESHPFNFHLRLTLYIWLF